MYFFDAMPGVMRIILANSSAIWLQPMVHYFEQLLYHSPLLIIINRLIYQSILMERQQ